MCGVWTSLSEIKVMYVCMYVRNPRPAMHGRLVWAPTTCCHPITLAGIRWH